MPLVLDKTELKNRIDALRTLRGLTQVDLAELFAAKGHGVQELGRLERGALPLTDIRKRTLAEILEVPERFFEDEHLDLTEDGPPATQLSRLERGIADLARREDEANEQRDGIRALLAQQSKILSDIAGLLQQQDQVLSEIQRVVAGMPEDETLRLLAQAGVTLRDANVQVPRPPDLRPPDEDQRQTS